MVNVPRLLRSRYPHIQFRRHWEISPGVHYQLGQCEAIITAICEMPLQPERYGELLRVSLRKGAQATTAIEGNTLTDAEVAKVDEGGTLAPSKEYQKLELRNILDAMNGLLREVVAESKSHLVSQELLLKFHELVGRDLGDHFDAVPGRMRTDERVVGPYKCPKPEDVPALIRHLCQWLQDEFEFDKGNQTFATAVVQAIVTHVYVEWIHPFGDGNGRTGRLLEFYILLRAGNPDIASHILSNFYNLTRPEYYRQLDRANKARDLSAFIGYAVQGYRDGLFESLQTIQSSLFATCWRTLIYDRFARERYRKKNVFKRRRDLMLCMPTDRDVSLAEWTTLDAELIRDYASLSDATLRRDVETLVKMELIRPGSSPGRYAARTEILRRQMPARTNVSAA